MTGGREVADQLLTLRVQRLEDRAAIQELVVLYGYVMDEHDSDGIRDLFCVDATMRSSDGVIDVTGIDHIVEMFRGRYAVLGPTNHFTHGHVIRFDDEDPDVASGLLSSHAEVCRNGVAMLVALRYEDKYRRVDGRWRFADREMSYMYYLPAAEYVGGVGDPEGNLRAYGDRRPSQWPLRLHGDGARDWIASWLAAPRER
jgi:hypothetical protein